MLKFNKERKFSKLPASIYITIFFILLLGSMAVSHTIANNALYFDIDNCDINAMTYLY